MCVWELIYYADGSENPLVPDSCAREQGGKLVCPIPSYGSYPDTHDGDAGRKQATEGGM